MTSKRLIMAIVSVGRKTMNRTMMAKTVFAAAIALTLVPGSQAITARKDHLFTGSPDGSNPGSGLLSDGAGNFYGVTEGGGQTTCGFSAPFCGTVFKMTLSESGTWKESVIYRFKGGNDGAAPAGNLMFDHAGNLYGTTETGGDPQVCNGEGCGTVFKLSPGSNGTWTESVLYRFLGSTDVAQPGFGVVMDSAGNLYGAGGGGCIEECNGTIFKLAPGSNGTWTESILYTFMGGTDGGFPEGIVLNGAGDLFGTSISGGTSLGCDCGTIFELSPPQSGTTWEKTVLYNFDDGLGGGSPSSGVIFDGAGNLYGETFDGGSFACPQSGCGVVYELTPESESWKFSVIHTFNGVDGSKGSQPSGGLAFDSAGNLYGTTGTGGDAACNNGNGCGTIFKLSPKTGGGFNFSMTAVFNGATGASPAQGVIVDALGNLYGTTFVGGSATCNCGVAFAITP